MARASYSDPASASEDRHAISDISAVSWAAVFAGAIAAAALALILLILGMGLGMSAVSPWTPRGISAGTFGIAAIVWLTVTQVLASGLGAIWLAGCAPNGCRCI